MGCPKQFSVQGCMGSALLKTPDVAFSVNYKILNIILRLLKDYHQTRNYLYLVKYDY